MRWLPDERWLISQSEPLRFAMARYRQVARLALLHRIHPIAVTKGRHATKCRLFLFSGAGNLASGHDVD